ncbi:MAG: DnaJ C-terminal domain-containing protein, partial [Rhodospirillales bacterium]
VPTVDGGRARINVPAGSQTGHQFRLRDKGMTIMRTKSRGDMFVQAMIETPVNLNKKQKEILKEFESATKGGKHSPESQSFFTKVKEIWEDLKE